MKEVYLWDINKIPNSSLGEVILMKGFPYEKHKTSIPNYIEENSERLRKKYLSFIFDLAHSKIRKKTIIDHLKIKSGFSFWWMTSIAEKSPFKTSRIYDCLRLIALEEVAKIYGFQSIMLVSEDKCLAQSIKAMCEGSNIKFRWLNHQTSHGLELKSIKKNLPHALQAVFSLRHVFSRWILRDVKVRNWYKADKSIFICSYFFNLKKNSNPNEFYSNLWGRLQTICNELKVRINWLQIYLSTPEISRPKFAKKLLSQFNEEAIINNGPHKFLESYLSLGLICRVICLWFFLISAYLKTVGVSKNFKLNNSSVWLWPILKNDWKSSVLGAIAMSNCLWFELFDSALRELPHQKAGFYLWENQGWEQALLWAWGKHGHGVIVGVPHTTICYWHLNNFEDQRSYSQKNSDLKQRPTLLAVNGRAAWENFVRSGYPVADMREVEALRFIYLDKKEKSLDIKAFDIREIQPMNSEDLLVLGDFSYSQTLKMLQLIGNTSSIIGKKINVTLKPHPICKIDNLDFAGINLRISNESIEELAKKFRISFVGNSSSAGLDALLAGLSVAIFFDGEDFNHSPLRKSAGVKFISSPKDLASFINSYEEDLKKNVNAEEYFWLDGGLERWRSLLSELGIE